jgi:hypothetical protein
MTTEAITISLPVSIEVGRKDRVLLVEWLQDEPTQASLRITGPYEGRYHVKGPIALTPRFATLPAQNLSKRDHRALEQGETVWRPKHPQAPAFGRSHDRSA